MSDTRLTLVAAVVAVLAVAGCGDADADGVAAGEGTSSAPAPASTSSGTGESVTETSSGAGASAATAEPTSSSPAEQLAGCERYADPEVAAQVAQQPVLEVIAEDPALGWLHSAMTVGVSPEVDYSDVLVGGPFTVFATVDDAMTEELRQELAADPATLQFLLDYHVVPGQALSPQELVDAAAATDTGTVPTLQGWGIAAFAPVDGSAELALSEDVVVPLCGDITTADATLYLVPALMHPAGDYVVPGSGELVGSDGLADEVRGND